MKTNSILILIIICLVACKEEKSNINSRAKSIVKTKINKDITWKHGIAIIKGRPMYVDRKKSDQATMVVTKKYISKHQRDQKKIIKAARLSWDLRTNSLETSDSYTKDPYWPISKSYSEYKYKIQNNKMYLTKDNKKWSVLEVKIINDNPPVYLIIYLKCKWFRLSWSGCFFYR